MPRDLVLAVAAILVGQHRDRARRRSSPSSRPCSPCRGTACRSGRDRRGGVADHHVHQAVGGERRLPGERLVDAPRRAVGLDQQILGPASESRGAGRPSARRRNLICLAGRLRCRRDGFGKGGLKRNPPGASMLPSSICSRCSARQVWKPLECAEMPRMACMLTGRPMHLSCRRPASRSRAGRAPAAGERDLRQLGRDAADRCGRNAAARPRRRARRPGRDSARP